MPSEADSEKPEKQIQPSDERKTTENKAKGGPPVTVATVEIADSVLEEFRAYQKRQDQENKKNRGWEKAAVISALILAALAIIQGWLTYQSVQSIRTQVDEMKEANKIAREGLAKGDLRAKEANESARDTIIREQRPWVGTGPIRILNKPIEGQSIKIRMTILNGGRSPGVHFLHYTIFKPWISPSSDLNIPLMNDPEISQCFKPKPSWNSNFGGGIILPGVTNVYIDRESPILNKDMVDVITRKARGYEKSLGLKDIPQSPASRTADKLTAGLYLVGCMDYFDQFRNARRTSFCYLYEPLAVLPNGDFSTCATGNAAD